MLAARIEARHSEEFSKYLTFSPRYLELKIEAGSVFLLIPGAPHWYAPDQDTGWARRPNR